jgi:hypothetical protein
MEFSKDSSRLFHAIHSQFYWRISKKAVLLVLKILTKNLRNSSLFILWSGKMRQKLECEKTRVYNQKSRLMPFKNSISVLKECPLLPQLRCNFLPISLPHIPPPPSPQLLLSLHIFLGKVTVEIGSYGCSIKRNFCLLLSVVIYLTINIKKFRKKLQKYLNN